VTFRKIRVKGKMSPIRNKYVVLSALSMLLLSACASKPVIKESDSERLFKEANSSYYRGEYREAEEKYRASLSSSNDPEVLANLACLYKDTGRFSEAAGCYAASLELKKDGFRQLNYALCLYQSGNYEGASAAAEKLIFPEAGQENFVKFYALVVSGCCAEAAGKTKEAETLFSSALELKPFSASVKQKLAEACAASGDAERAVSLYNEVLRLDSSLYPLNFKIAGIRERQGNIRGAYEALSRLSMSEPGYPGVSAGLKKLAAKIPASEKKSDEDYQEAGRKANKCPEVRPISARDKNPVIRVMLVSGVDSLRIKCGSAVKFSLFGRITGAALPEQEIRVRSSNRSFSVKDAGGNELIKERFKGDTPLIFENPGGASTFTIYDVTLNKGYFWSKNEDRSYRGALEVTVGDDGLTLVNVLPLDEYLYSVVPSEINASSNIEALKAQAVVARSYAYGKFGMKTHPNADVCADVHCQAYSGVQNETPGTSEAVDATRGEVLLCGGKTLTAFFFSNCGGHTRDIEDVWRSDPHKAFKGRPDFPLEAGRGLYLEWPLTPEMLDRWIKAEPEAYCRKDRHFRWFKILEKPEKEIIVVKRDNFGYIKEVRRGEQIFTGDRVRSVLPGLRSNLVKFEGSFVYGAGFGHGVGMCQDGAAGMAEKGFSYKNILNHYFTESEVKSVY